MFGHLSAEDYCLQSMILVYEGFLSADATACDRSELYVRSKNRKSIAANSEINKTENCYLKSILTHYSNSNYVG